MNLAHHTGNTLVMLACYEGHAATTRMVLERGAVVDRRHDRGQTSPTAERSPGPRQKELSVAPTPR